MMGWVILLITFLAIPGASAGPCGTADVTGLWVSENSLNTRGQDGLSPGNGIINLTQDRCNSVVIQNEGERALRTSLRLDGSPNVVLARYVRSIIARGYDFIEGARVWVGAWDGGSTIPLRFEITLRPPAGVRDARRRPTVAVGSGSITLHGADPDECTDAVAGRWPVSIGITGTVNRVRGPGAFLVDILSYLQAPAPGRAGGTGVTALVGASFSDRLRRVIHIEDDVTDCYNYDPDGTAHAYCNPHILHEFRTLARDCRDPGTTATAPATSVSPQTGDESATAADGETP